MRFSPLLDYPVDSLMILNQVSWKWPIGRRAIKQQTEAYEGASSKSTGNYLVPEHDIGDQLSSRTPGGARRVESLCKLAPAFRPPTAQTA